MTYLILAALALQSVGVPTVQGQANPLNAGATPPPVPPAAERRERRVTPPRTAPETQADPEQAAAAECQSMVRRDPQAGLTSANAWQAAGGSLGARQCAGLAYVALERWSEAGALFEQAAQEAARSRDVRTADFWVQAGNAWLAAEQVERAMHAFGSALAAPGVTPELRGEAYLDRARALVATGDPVRARADIDQALQLVARDSTAWYLSAALALRQQDLPRARADIARAQGLAGADPDILLLAGTIAGRTGDMDEAVRLYREVVRAAPASDAAQQAAASLATLREIEEPAPARTPAPQATSPAPAPTPR